MMAKIVIAAQATWYFSTGYWINRSVIHHQINGAVMDAAFWKLE
ncbi:MAG: hypothetical protein WCJ39_06135 [bacterium]